MYEKPNHILVVDDDVAMLRMISKWLESAGYVVRTAANGREAIKAIEEECPQILLTDWEMPQMDGLDLCRWVRSQSLLNYVYILLLTMRTSSPDIIRGLDAGADDFAKKPLDRDELMARLQSGTRVVELERRMLAMAHTDPLTGLLTRRAFFDAIGKEWARTGRNEEHMSCVMLDIDFFKAINDTHGHAAGDQVLREVATRLRENTRAGDVICRYDGEEFCVLLTQATESGPMHWAQRLRQLFQNRPILLEGGETINISASFGFSRRRDDTATPEQIVDEAHQALLVAKRSGRNRVVDFTALASSLTTDPLGQNPAELLRQASARHVMSPITGTLRGDDSMEDATRLFLQAHTSSAPVVDSEGNLIGIVSEKDILTILLRDEWWKIPVKEVMKTDVVCYEEDASAQTIHEFLCRVTIRGVVIVKRRKPTGLINRGSLLRFFSAALAARRLPADCTQSSAAEETMLNLAYGNRTPARLRRAIGALATEAADLQVQMESPSDFLMPSLVGSVGRVQELVRDLLMCLRSTTAPGDDLETNPVISQSTSDTVLSDDLARTDSASVL